MELLGLEDIRFAETHEYVHVVEDRGRVGISQFAVDQLGDVVYLDLPEVGMVLEKGDTFGTVESIKAASDLYAPVSGEVLAINSRLREEPQLVNDDCYGDGWLIELHLSQPDEITQLLDRGNYQGSL